MNDTTDTILIVDDIPENAKVLLTLFRHDNFKMLVAEDGKEGIQMAEYAHPDLILLDVMMPGMDGFEVCKHLKSHDATQDIPIIFMTVQTDTVNKIKGLNLGAADYIAKPFQYKEVLARVNTHLNLRKLQRQLQAQNQQLQARTVELEQRQREIEAFAHTVAHDLKNPLNGIIGLLRLFLADCSTKKPPDAKAIENLRMAWEVGEHAVEIIDALLLLAGVARKKQVEYKPVDMPAILDRVINQRLVNAIKEYSGTIELPNSWPNIESYEPWIEEIWANYLSNGLKYGGHPPHLKLGTTVQDDGMVCFWVDDNGHGIDSEKRALLFMPFTRLHQKRVEGHGLGLSIVQQIVEKLGGQAGVESVIGQQGSRFYFILP